MVGWYDSGGGNPDMLDGGAGDVGFIGVGAGDPWSVIDLAASSFLRVWSPWEPDSEQGHSMSRYRNENIYSQEGGHPLELYVAGITWPDGPYRIDLIDKAGNTFPLLEPGASSFEPDGGSDIYPAQGGRALRFVMPPAAIGVYALRITQISTVAEKPNLIRIVPTPYSIEVQALRDALPGPVYRTYPDRER